MAIKCPVCNGRKGKRKCLREEGLICSQCCGETRNAEACPGCEFYRDVVSLRRYGDAPRFSTAEMESDFELQTYSNTIEGALGLFDHNNRSSLNDSLALEVLEKLLDRYHFHDAEVVCGEELVQAGFDLVLHAKSEDLADVPEEILVRILGVIRFVAKRRTHGGREYFNIIQQYVGTRIGPGVRLAPHPLA